VTADVFLVAQEANASVSAVCRALDVPRSTQYARRGREQSPREKATAKLDVDVAAVFKESKGRYGSPRVHRELRARGRRVGRKRVAARMRAQGLVARRPKRWRRTTRSNPEHSPAPNVLDRRFNWPKPAMAWAGDITYVWTLAGWAYLALLVDLCSRRIVGWAVSTRCNTALALEALNAAVGCHRPPPGLIHHTDQGSTYTAADYRERIKHLGFVESMSRRGNCWDNAVAESTIGTIKQELLDDWTPEDVHDLRHALFPYIEGFYNRRRLHSSIGYVSPETQEALADQEALVA